MLIFNSWLAGSSEILINFLLILPDMLLTVFWQPGFCLFLESPTLLSPKHKMFKYLKLVTRLKRSVNFPLQPKQVFFRSLTLFDEMSLGGSAFTASRHKKQKN